MTNSIILGEFTPETFISSMAIAGTVHAAVERTEDILHALNLTKGAWATTRGLGGISRVGAFLTSPYFIYSGVQSFYNIATNQTADYEKDKQNVVGAAFAALNTVTMVLCPGSIGVQLLLAGVSLAWDIDGIVDAARQGATSGDLFFRALTVGLFNSSKTHRDYLSKGLGALSERALQNGTHVANQTTGFVKREALKYYNRKLLQQLPLPSGPVVFDPRKRELINALAKNRSGLFGDIEASNMMVMAFPNIAHTLSQELLGGQIPVLRSQKLKITGLIPAGTPLSVEVTRGKKREIKDVGGLLPLEITFKNSKSEVVATGEMQIGVFSTLKGLPQPKVWQQHERDGWRLARDAEVINQEQVNLFGRLTGDNNAVHCAGIVSLTGLKKPVVQGSLIDAQLAGCGTKFEHDVFIETKLHHAYEVGTPSRIYQSEEGGVTKTRLVQVVNWKKKNEYEFIVAERKVSSLNPALNEPPVPQNSFSEYLTALMSELKLFVDYSTNN